MNLQLESLDALEAPIDNDEGLVIVAIAGAAGVLVGLAIVFT